MDFLESPLPFLQTIQFLRKAEAEEARLNAKGLK